MDIGAKIRKLRELRGMTQQALAEKVGVKLITIGRYERGERVPNSAILQKIAKKLAVKPSFLLGEETKETVRKIEKDRLSNVCGRMRAENRELLEEVLGDREGRRYLLQQARFWLIQRKKE